MIENCELCGKKYNTRDGYVNVEVKSNFKNFIHICWDCFKKYNSDYDECAREYIFRHYRKKHSNIDYWM